MYDCRYCGKSFGYIQSRSRHENHRCEKRKLSTDIIEKIPKLDVVSPSREKISSNDEKLVNDVNININYVLPKQNYWMMLKEKKGVKGALQFLHRCADLKIGGDILLFEELFLPQDNKESWAISRKEGSSKEIILREPDGTIIDECASRVVYDRFAVNYKDALLTGSNQILSILIEPLELDDDIEETTPVNTDKIKTKIKNITSEQLESAYIDIFTEYDFGLFQDRAWNMEHEHPKPHGKFAQLMLSSSF